MSDSLIVKPTAARAILLAIWVVLAHAGLERYRVADLWSTGVAHWVPPAGLPDVLVPHPDLATNRLDERVVLALDGQAIALASTVVTRVVVPVQCTHLDSSSRVSLSGLKLHLDPLDAYQGFYSASMVKPFDSG